MRVSARVSFKVAQYVETLGPERYKEWAGVIREHDISGKDVLNCDETELLELFSGFGHNTVALAPYFSHIVSVEINRLPSQPGPY